MVLFRGSKFNISTIIALIIGALIFILVVFDILSDSYIFGGAFANILFLVWTFSALSGGAVSLYNYARVISSEADLPDEALGMIKELEDNDDIDY